MKLCKINQLRWLNMPLAASGKGLEGMLCPAGIAWTASLGKSGERRGIVALGGAYLVSLDSVPPRGQESLDFQWSGSETECAVQKLKWASFLKKLLTNPAYIFPVAVLEA